MVLAVWSFAYQQGGSSGSIDFRKFSEERIVIEDQINTQQENENLKKHDKYTSVFANIKSFFHKYWIK